tara:strand:+ start:572 stop:964 length:393 start_codon:yes stop_codon:yes gene_type:complete
MIRHFIPGIFWGVIILVLSGMPGSYIPEVQSYLDWLEPDKLVHVLMYAAFVFLCLYGIYKNRAKSLLKHQYYVILGIGIAFGGLTEVLQKHLFIGRNGNIFDFYADILGCLIGLIIYLVYQRKKTVKVRQ